MLGAIGIIIIIIVVVGVGVGASQGCSIGARRTAWLYRVCLSHRSPHPRATLVVDLDMAWISGPGEWCCMAWISGPVAGRSGLDFRARPGPDFRATLALISGPGFCFS